MATKTWIKASNSNLDGGAWSDPTGWSDGSVPVSGDTVLLNLETDHSAGYTVALDANEGPYAALTVSSTNVSLYFDVPGVTLSVSGQTTLSNGYISLGAPNAALDTGTFSETGGWLGISDGEFVVSDQATLSGGGEDIYGGAFSATALTVSGGNFGQSGGAAMITGLAQVNGGSVAFYDGAFNAGSIAVSNGNIGASGGTVTASGALDLSGSGAIGIYNSAARFQAGSFSETGGSLGMSGGTIAVSGQASFTGGSSIFYAGSNFDAGTLNVGAAGSPVSLSINGGVVTASAQANIASGSTVSINGGTLSANGGIVDSGLISGSGTLAGPISGDGTITAQNGTLTLNDDIHEGIFADIAADSSLVLNGNAGVPVQFLYPRSGNLVLASANAVTSFENSGTLAGMDVNSSGAFPTTVLDLADIMPSSFTSGSVVNGNTIALYNGSNLVNHYTLGSNVGTAVVHLISDGQAGTDVFLATT